MENKKSARFVHGTSRDMAPPIIVLIGHGGSVFGRIKKKNFFSRRPPRFCVVRSFFVLFFRMTGHVVCAGVPACLSLCTRHGRSRCGLAGGARLPRGESFFSSQVRLQKKKRSHTKHKHTSQRALNNHCVNKQKINTEC